MKALPKLIMQMTLIIVLLVYSFQKSTLQANYISSDNCDTESDRYSFEIYCELNGDLSQSMLNSFTIKSNSYYEPEIKCEIPESSQAGSRNINIPCYVKNFYNGELSFKFEGESDEIELINFNENVLSLNIYCEIKLILKFGDIIDQECQNHEYEYKIKLLNEILPRDLYNMNYMNLMPTIIRNPQDSDKYIYVNCNLNINDYNNYFLCTFDYSRKLEATIYYEKNYTYENWDNYYQILIKNENNDLYVGQNIICYKEPNINILNILKGNCKNGIFFFSIDLSTFGNNIENSEIYSKSLYEFKTKVNSEIYKNYCYLENRNEDGKYDILKYKMNCAITNFDDVDPFKYQTLFSEVFFVNRFIKSLYYYDIYCHSFQKYITSFYYYYDACSNNNNIFKILAVTSFNNNIFNSTLNDTIEIPIISPFESIATCKISSLTLESYIEFNCIINNYETIDYKNLVFGNVTTKAYYDGMNPIEFDGFEGKHIFGKYCSTKGPKCSQLIQNDYGYNSININNPKVYEYSFCKTSDDNSFLNKEFYNILFNDNSFGNCSVKSINNVHDNTNETQVKCIFDEETLNKYPFLKNFNKKINFTLYNNLYKDFNRFVNFLKDTSEIDYDTKIKIKESKNYYCLNNKTVLLILSTNYSKKKENNQLEEFMHGVLDSGLELFYDYSLNNILDNSMNLSFIKNYYDWISTQEISCLIRGDFSHENNIIIKKDLNYKTFFNNYSIIWENKILKENIICDNDEKIIFYKYKKSGDSSIRLFAYSLYTISLYDNNGHKTDKLLLNIKINGESVEYKATCSGYSGQYNYGNNFDIYCNFYDINYVLNDNDIITFEECDESIIKTQDGIKLKIEGLDKINYKYHGNSQETKFGIYNSGYGDQNENYCNEYGYYFNLSYYINGYMEDINNIITQYSINNLINPINNKTIEGNCSFIEKNEDSNNYDEGNYYDQNKYVLSCHIYSNLFDVESIKLKKNYLDKKNNSLPNISIENNYYDERIYINDYRSVSCAKATIFTINEIKDKDCLDGTYIFKFIGTLSNDIESNNDITIRETLENGIQIFCNNLSHYGLINEINYYSFNCYVLNSKSNDSLNINLLNTPPNSEIITIRYSQDFNYNEKINFNFKCVYEDKANDMDNEISSTLDLINSFTEKTSIDSDLKKICFKVIAKIDHYPNKKIDEYYNKYLGKYLFIVTDCGVGFCSLNGKNLINNSILKCSGICGKNKKLDNLKIEEFNSLNIFVEETNRPNISFLEFIDNCSSVYTEDTENTENKENLQYKINHISPGCINNKYNFNITGQILGDIMEYYESKESFYSSLPEEISLSLENNLNSKCTLHNNQEDNLQLICFVEINNELNNEEIKFDVSQIEKAEKNIIIDGLLDYLKTTTNVIESNVNCGKTDAPIIIEPPQFDFYSIDVDGYINGHYYFYINGNMANYINNNPYNIGTITIKVLGTIYSATCHSGEFKSPDKSYNYRFKCSFIPPPQYFNSIEINEPTNFTGFNLTNWPNEIITKNKENVCSDYKFSVSKYKDIECTIDSNSFSFEIEMESSLKEGNLKDKTINLNVTLNITQPSTISTATCQLKNKDLNSNITLNCLINGLDQEKRITNGIKIEGIIKNNITDEYLITENNVYIKIIDFKEIQLSNIECPKEFTISHCKEVNKKEKKCTKCHSSYLIKDDKECLTCSQLKEGCSTCKKNGECKNCLNGFRLEGSNCVKKVDCPLNTFAPQCKTCKELNPNCEQCHEKSGYCKKCEKGYYLTGIDNNSKCVKCISTCEECDSLNKCTKCKDGLILNVKDYSCVSCFSLNEGCEECNKHGKCTKCLDDKNFKYKIKDDKCIKKEEKNEPSKTNLKFERLDGFEHEDDKIHFKSHFLLLDNYLYNSLFEITIKLQTQIKKIFDDRRYLRGLDETIQSTEVQVTCNQYGDSLGSMNKGGYLANYKCTTELGEDRELVSIEPTNMEIKDKDNNLIQNFKTENVPVSANEISKESLDNVLENTPINKLNILDISDVKLKDNDLTFNIICNIDLSIQSEKEYEISLKDNDNIVIPSTCNIPVLNDLNNQAISCKALINKESKISDLSFVDGFCPSKISNDDFLLLYNKNNVNIKIPEEENKKLSLYVIIGIGVGFLVICGLTIFLIVKCKASKKKNEDIAEIPNTEIPYQETKKDKSARMALKGSKKKKILKK